MTNGSEACGTLPGGRMVPAPGIVKMLPRMGFREAGEFATPLDSNCY